MPSLVAERGQEKGFTFPVRDGETVVVGRDPANEIIISDPAASRRHFQIRQVDGMWMVSDLGSRNSTYVNEEQIEQEMALAFGDRVQVGETVFSFLEEDAVEGKAKGLAGKDIGGYKILDRLGRGGMGTVYKARQISLNRICALKVLAAKYAKDPTFVAQFVAEARSAAVMQHPNVVQVFDVGEAGGLNFFSMEYMEGAAVQDLCHKREDSRLHWTEAMPMVMQSAQGLEYAEKQGIIHRDIKPDNLMLTDQGVVKIGDLGLAMKADESSAGKIFGTPHFIAPEQALGREVTNQADIYSLGASFYRMVVGRTPFSGSTVKEILRAQINEPHIPVVDEVEDFPPDLSDIIDQMMEKKTGDRYATATALIADLKAFELAHQIELSGVKKNYKPIFAAAAVVILGLIAYAVHLATKPDTIKEVKGDERIVYKDREGEVKTPADMQKARERDAEIAVLKAERGDPGRDITREQGDAWLKQADAYDALAKEHRGTKAGTAAGTKAKNIRDTLTRLEEEFKATVGAAQEWWKGEHDKIMLALSAGDWSGVLATSKSLANTPDAKKHLPHVPEAVEILAGLEASVLKAARESFDSVIADATKLLNGGDPGGAIAMVMEWEQAMRGHAGAHADLAKLADDAKQWTEDKGQEYKAQLDAQRGQDRLAYVAAVTGIRASDGGALTFDFATAAQRLRSTTTVIQTWLYKDRADLTAERLETIDAAWKAFLQAVAAGEIVDAKETLTGIPRMPRGAKATLAPEQKSIAESFAVDISIGPAKAGRKFRWDSLTLTQLREIFLNGRLNKVDPGTAVGLSWMAVELADGELAGLLLDRAVTGGAVIDIGEHEALKLEIEALKAFLAIAAASGADPDVDIQAVAAWRAKYFETEIFARWDGRTGSDVPDLFRAGKIKAFLDSWGVKPR